MSFIVSENMPTIICCNVCGEQRNLDHALKYKTHTAMHKKGKKAKHICKWCQEKTDSAIQPGKKKREKAHAH